MESILTVKIMGRPLLKVWGGTYAGFISWIENRAAQRLTTRIGYLNPETFLRICFEREVRAHYEGMDCLIPDGFGIALLLSRLPGPKVSRLSGTDFFSEYSKLLSDSSLRFFFLGGAHGVASAAAEQIEAYYKSPIVVGAHHGYCDSCDSSLKQLASMISGSKPDVVFVCMGTPRQERFVALYGEWIDAPVLFANGGALDFWSGRRRRAPRAMRVTGMEWLYRLTQEFSVDRVFRSVRSVLLFPILGSLLFLVRRIEITKIQKELTTKREGVKN